MTMTFDQVHAAVTQSGTWVSYGGAARIVLAVVLVAAAGGVAYAGIRLPLPVRPARPSESARTFMLVTWGLAITAFLVCLPIYVKQARREHLFHTAPPDPITPVTAICVAVIFVIIFTVGRSRGWRAALGSAVIGAVAAPMIFEFPFDLIVMARTYPPIPPDPALYRILFFAPLFLIEVTTLALLRLSAMVKLSRSSFFFFAVMLVVFAVWGLSGFGYPSAPVPFALNVLSKIVAFAAALSLFLPQRAQASTPGPATSPPAMVMHAATGTGETGKARGPAALLTLPDRHLRRGVMNEGTGMTDGAGASEAAGMDAQGAAAIMQQARQQARHELTVNRPVIFVSWALVYLLGYGVVWLSVRGQRPFHAPEGWALALLALLAVLALGVTAGVTDRAASGVGGVSQLRRRIYWLSLAVGLLGVYVMQPALRHAGAGHGAISVFTASSPLLAAGVVLAAGTAAWLNWYAFGLGTWLIAVAAFSGFAGPAGVWAVDALAVGIPFLVIAAITLARGRS